MAVVGHCEVPLQGFVVTTQLQLQQLGVVHPFLPLDVDGRLAFASAGSKVLSPVLFIQLTLCGGEANQVIRMRRELLLAQQSENIHYFVCRTTVLQNMRPALQ